MGKIKIKPRKKTLHNAKLYMNNEGMYVLYVTLNSKI
jgi:hypothetical protein